MADDTPATTDPTAFDPTALDPDADVVSRRRARKWWWGLGAFAFVAVLAMMWLGRQSSTDVPPASTAFCDAAARYEDELERQAAAYERDVGRQIQFVENIAATAPRAVRADADLFLESLRKLEAAPNEKARDQIRDDPEVKQAVDNVNRRWNLGCGVFDRQSGGF